MLLPLANIRNTQIDFLIKLRKARQTSLRILKFKDLRNGQYSICPIYDKDSLDLIWSNRLSKLPDNLNRSFWNRLIEEIIPWNSDIGNIGKFEGCDLDIFRKNKNKIKNQKNLPGYIDFRNFQYTRICGEKRATSYAREYKTRSLRSPQK